MSNIDLRRGGARLTMGASPFVVPLGGFESPLVLASFGSAASPSGSAISHPSAVMSVPICSDDSIRSTRTRSTFRILPRNGKMA